MRWLRNSIFAICVVLVAAACGPQPKPFPEGNGDLRSSQDTLRFDTLFSTISSTTAWLKIYNAGREALTIDSVFLSSGGSSGFRASVDALPLSECKGLRILSGDSLFVFVELTAPMQHQVEPQSIVDELCFISRQETMKVVLEACAWDALFWRGKTVTSDTTLTASSPYVIYDSLVVLPGATLRLMPGTTLYFHDGAALMVYGTLLSEGSLDSPVIFRGDRLDWAFDDFPYEWYPGQWTGVYLGTESYGNRLDFTYIRGAYYGIISDEPSAPDSMKLTLSNSRLFNMSYSCLYALGSKMEVSNTLLANSGSYTLALIGGDAVFTHCTVANYQLLVAREENTPAVVVVNFTQDEKGKKHPYPLRQASFRNSIIYGSRENELGFGLMEEHAHQVSFDACIVRNKEVLAEDISSRMLYNEDPCFRSINDNYRYDFHLDSVSPAIGKADIKYSKDFPLDADGKSRLEDEAPDLGIYEYEESSR